MMNWAAMVMKLQCRVTVMMLTSMTMMLRIMIMVQ